MSNRAPLRILAGLAAAALFVVVAFGLIAFVWGLSYVSEPADPYVMDGDPCCAHPDTWGDVTSGAWGTLAIAAVTGLVLCAAMALLVLAITGRLPPLWRVAVVEAGCVVLGAALVAAMALPHRGEAHARIDCRSFAFDRAAWAAGGPRHDDVARGLDRCHTLHGRTAAQVRALLGPPEGSAPALHSPYLRYPGLEISFAGSRVDDARATSFPG